MKQGNHMNIRSLALLVALVFVLSFAFTGCGSNSTAQDENVKTKVITDCMDRQVEIPEDPQRVACLYATAAHMMAMLDVQDRIVGCPNGVKSDVLMQMKYPEIKDTATPHEEGSINTEELLRIDADIAFVSYSLAESDGEMQKLDKMDIPYVVVDYTTMDELDEAIEVTGEVFNKKEKAQNYIDFEHETLDMVDERLADVSEEDEPNVYHSVNEATRTDPEDSICQEIMEEAKVHDISADKGTVGEGKNCYVTLEEIYNWNPDAFINNESSVTDYILSDSKWSSLNAVKNKKVYTLPVGATRWCHPGSMEAHMGVLAVAIQFYPEKFEDFDLKQYVKDYYDKYFKLSLDEKTLNKILTGEGMRISNSPTN